MLLKEANIIRGQAQKVDEAVSTKLLTRRSSNFIRVAPAQTLEAKKLFELVQKRGACIILEKRGVKFKTWDAEWANRTHQIFLRNVADLLFFYIWMKSAQMSRIRAA
ncbi:hypothetical protein CEXT_475011 [Caerostris extrusa]|uniref:Uncharacterized protein n=1 Tax=Caerostris extrusa TaxID=172846 RepID=A0AAV4MYL5_CAEEX|nr:hypothetical protein CEXT_475011 [Caerostris extrusa]